MHSDSCCCSKRTDCWKTAPAFSLEDQYGKVWKHSNLKGKVVVVMAANPDSGSQMGPWVDNLKTRYGSRIRIIGLLDIHTVPAVGRWVAKSRIKKLTKERIMLDFDVRTAKAYSVSSKYPVITVIDKSGLLIAVHKTAYNKDSFSKIAKAADKALKEAMKK